MPKKEVERKAMSEANKASEVRWVRIYGGPSAY
jgi:hypothetical protein